MLRKFKDECERVMDALAEYYRNRFASLQDSEILAIKDDGDVTRKFDRDIESAFIEVFERSKLPIRVLSEEVGLIDLSGSPEYLAILDPLDGSFMASNGYPLCSISFTLYSLSEKMPVLSIIKEVFTDNTYSADTRSSYLNNKQIRIKDEYFKPLSEAFVVSYMASNARVRNLDCINPVIRESKMFLNYGGPLDIAKVGSGQCDVFIEVLKGFKPMDYMPGAHIASKANAVITRLDGVNNYYDIDENSKVKFVCSNSKRLNDEILILLS